MKISLLPIERTHQMSAAAESQFILDMGKYISDSIIANTEKYSKYVTIDLVKDFDIPVGDVQFWINKILENTRIIQNYSDILDEEELKEQRISQLREDINYYINKNDNLLLEKSNCEENIEKNSSSKETAYTKYKYNFLTRFNHEVSQAIPVVHYFLYDTTAISLENLRNSLIKLVRINTSDDEAFKDLEQYLGYKYGVLGFTENYEFNSEMEFYGYIEDLIAKNAPVSHLFSGSRVKRFGLSRNFANWYRYHSEYESTIKTLENSIIQNQLRISNIENEIMENNTIISSKNQEILNIENNTISTNFSYYYLYQTYSYDYEASVGESDLYVVTTNKQPKGFILFWNKDGENLVLKIKELVEGDLATYYKAGESVPKTDVQNMINAVEQYNILIGGK